MFAVFFFISANTKYEGKKHKISLKIDHTRLILFKKLFVLLKSFVNFLRKLCMLVLLKRLSVFSGVLASLGASMELR